MKEVDRRPRGEVLRIEAFSDAVFGFAVTLLVISLEVPRTFTQLEEAMRGLGAFAIGFAILFQIWFLQHRFFRRYGLEDTTTMILNAVLLFVVVAYVYPLKFLFTWLVNAFTGGPTKVPLPGGGFEPVVANEKTVKLMVLYGVGYVAVFAIFFLLFLHAYRRREEIGLTLLEVFDTSTSLYTQLAHVGVGLFSISLALLGPGFTFWSGVSYALLGPVMAVLGARRGRARAALERTAAAKAA